MPWIKEFLKGKREKSNSQSASHLKDLPDVHYLHAGLFFFMFRSVGIPDNFSMIISTVKKFRYIIGFGGIQNDIGCLDGFY